MYLISYTYKMLYIGEWCALALINDEIGEKCMHIMVVIGTLSLSTVVLNNRD